jgi:hypothetical protein
VRRRRRSETLASTSLALDGGSVSPGRERSQIVFMAKP